MRLAEFFPIVEAAKERMISRDEIEKNWPNVLVSFDRDVGQHATHATFFTTAETGSNYDMTLYANTKGAGWWEWDIMLGGKDSGGAGGWKRVEKPGAERGPRNFKKNTSFDRERPGFDGASVRQTRNDLNNTPDNDDSRTLHAYVQPMKGGGSPNLWKQVKGMSADEQEARLDMEYQWAQIAWPADEPYLSPYIMRLRTKGRR